MMLDPGQLALGKKLGRVEDPRTFKLKSFLLPDAPRPPTRWRIARGFRAWPMLANDRVGCCTCAASAHATMAMERSAGQHELQVTEADVLEAYSAVTGYQPGNPSTDNGAYCLDVLNYRRRVGIGTERDGTRHTIDAFVKVTLNERTNLKRAAWMFGGLYIGIWLPVSAQHEGVWDAPEGNLAGDDEPGSWGGHCVEVIGYGPTGFTVVTWGREQVCTWRFWDAYVDEAFCVISEDFFRKSGTTPQGFDAMRLQQTLAAL